MTLHSIASNSEDIGEGVAFVHLHQNEHRYYYRGVMNLAFSNALIFEYIDNHTGWIKQKIKNELDYEVIDQSKHTGECRLTQI